MQPLKTPIAIFFHSVFIIDNQLLTYGCEIITAQMERLGRSGLLSAAQEMHVGINGGEETRDLARHFLPAKANLLFHGLHTRNENRTLLALEEWIKTHPGWNVLYFHAKGASHPKESSYHTLVTPWREKMMRACVDNWRQCVGDLDSGFESVGADWMTGPGMPLGQSIWAGNFWWATSDFLRTLPSITERDRIKTSGIDALESRYEAEVWIGNGPQLPKIRDYTKA